MAAPHLKIVPDVESDEEELEALDELVVTEEDEGHLRPPSPALLALEARAVLELGWFVQSLPLLSLTPRGDGHPVLVLPGFTAGDLSTVPLRRFLETRGFHAHGWKQGRNLGMRPGLDLRMARRLRGIHWRFGCKVSLVGWSLGGIYARELARQHPDQVRQVITLGSPFRIDPNRQRSAVSAIYDRLSPTHDVSVDDLLPGMGAGHLDVPATAIYTRTDGVVRWWQCIESVGDRRENIEVRGSHSGLGFNPAVMYAISDRLAQPAGTWSPFRAPLGFGHQFPHPADWAPDAGTVVA